MKFKVILLLLFCSVGLSWAKQKQASLTSISLKPMHSPDEFGEWQSEFTKDTWAIAAYAKLTNPKFEIEDFWHNVVMILHNSDGLIIKVKPIGENKSKTLKSISFVGVFELNDKLPSGSYAFRVLYDGKNIGSRSFNITEGQNTVPTKNLLNVFEWRSINFDSSIQKYKGAHKVLFKNTKQGLTVPFSIHLLNTKRGIADVDIIFKVDLLSPKGQLVESKRVTSFISKKWRDVVITEKFGS